jgi:ATP-dependent helicase HrpA
VPEKPQPHGATAASPAAQQRTAARAPSKFSGEERYAAWTFGTLPELLEIERKGQSLIGFPALVDAGDAVTIEVFDEPELAEQKHRLGLRRLFALQIKDALRYAQKNLPDFQRMAAAYMLLGTADELAAQIMDVALERAFLADPLPLDAAQFERRLSEGRTRVALISREVALLAGRILGEYVQAQRKLKDAKAFPEVAKDVGEQLARLMAPRFLEAHPWDALEHFPRYLKAVVLRLDKLRADPARDAEHMATVRALDQRYARVLAQRKGRTDEVLQRLRWMLEELRVSLFAQALRTPQPVSVKRIEKLWAQVL